MNRCSGRKDVTRNLNLFHAARQWPRCAAPAQSGCFWGSSSAFGEFAGSVAVSAIESDTDSLIGLGIDAAMDRSVKASRAMRTMCIANVVKVSLMYLCMTIGGKKERNPYCELSKIYHDLNRQLETSRSSRYVFAAACI